MNNLFRLIIKNFKLLIRSRSSALIVIAGPVLIILFVGLAFNTKNISNIKIGIYAQQYNTDIEGIVKELVNKKFKIIKIESEEMCVYEIKNGAVNACIIFPPNMSFTDIKQKSEITFYVDNSKINLVYMILDVISAQIKTTSVAISKDITGIILKKIELSRTELLKQDSSLDRLLRVNAAQHETADNVETSIARIYTKFSEDTLKTKKIEWNTTLVQDTNNRFVKYSFPLIDEIIKTQSDVKQKILDFENKFKDLDSKRQEGIRNKESENPGTTTQDDETYVELKDNINQLVQDFNNLDQTLQSDMKSFNNNLPKMTGINKKATKNIIDLIKTARKSIAELRDKIFSAGNKTDRIIDLLDESKKQISDIKISLDSVNNGLKMFDVSDAENITSPIVTVIKPVSREDTYLNYLLPSLIVLVIMFISILLSCILVMLEKHSPAYFRNFIVPVNNFTFILATFLSSLIVIIIQVSIILVISSNFFQAKIIENIFNIVPVILLVSIVFILIGMLVGYVFTSEETSTLAAISIGSVFLFVSDLILPIESMPEYFVKIAKFNPFVMGQVILKKTILFQSGLNTLRFEITTLSIYAILMFVFIYLMQLFLRNTFLRSFVYKFVKKLSRNHTGDNLDVK
ncbi:MAG: ABC transporter permease [Elusimicrobia bacterium]|nr:ABC transporter permease [Elusimicrobiota bacterium]